MTNEQKEILNIKAKKFKDAVKEILSDDDFDDFSFELFVFITDFCFEHRETSEGSKEK